jgi:hypothetical protein
VAVKSGKNLALSFILLLTFVGCPLSEGEDESQVRLSIQGNTDLLRRSLSVMLVAPGWIKGLTGRDFGTPESANYTQTFETPHSGNLRIDLLLQDSFGGHPNSGSISVDIRPDWVWDVDIAVSNRNPFYGCFGCIGSQTFALDSVYQRTPGDSLFVIWGGNSIKHPVIY